MKIDEKNDDDDNDGLSAKWWKTGKKARSKDKKPVHCTDDELEYNSTSKSSSEVSEPKYEEKDEKEAKICYFTYQIY